MFESLIRGIFEYADFVLLQPCIFGDFENAVARISEDAEDPRLYCIWVILKLSGCF